MNKYNVKSSIAMLHVACTAFFCCFVFLYLYYYQADVLAVVQHTLSKGQTHYDRTIGALLITIVLYLAHLANVQLLGRSNVCFAFTFFVPLFLLSLLTGITVSGDSFSVRWLMPLLLVVGFPLLGVFVSRKMFLSEDDLFRHGTFSRIAWLNFLVLSLLCIFSCMSVDADRHTHISCSMESEIAAGDYGKALEISRLTDCPNAEISMLVCYSLSRQGQLPDRLFSYPVSGQSSFLLPDGERLRLHLIPVNQLYDYLGGRVSCLSSPMEYLRLLQRKGRLKKPGIDYLLCGYLLDCDRDAFVDELPKYYAINDSLPRHYREALVLHTHHQMVPDVEYRDNVMEADYQDFLKIKRSIPDRVKMLNKLRDVYGNTYWYYYEVNCK